MKMIWGSRSEVDFIKVNGSFKVELAHFAPTSSGYNQHLFSGTPGSYRGWTEKKNVAEY
jgi:hypothetical protein